MMPRLATLGLEPPDPVIYGNKAAGLWRLQKCEVRIPPTVMVAAGLQPGWAELAWIAEQLGNPAEYVVRSSSSNEDSTSESLAGVFSSEVAERPTVLAAVERVRNHAATSSVCRPGQHPIPVLIQPRLGGPGGVYLFDRQSGRDSLTLSALGPSAVTSGTTTSSDQLPRDAREYKAGLEACRGVARRLGSVDLELILVGGECVFLQCRPLTRPLSPQSTAGLNAYFPSWLPPLCGTLWVEQLVKIPALQEVRYEVGFIKWKERDTEQSDERMPSTSALADAERYYQDVLFPRWNQLLERVATDLDGHTLTPEKHYQSVLAAWDSFWTEYFNNPHEAILTAARSAAPLGMAITPNVRDRLRLFSSAAQEVVVALKAGSVKPDKLVNLPSVGQYLKLYGFYPLEGHDFSQPTLDEQPGTFLAQLTQAGQVELPNLTSDDVLLRVAWLAEDDNEYKHKFCAMLRKSILRLGADWVPRGVLPAREDIWQLTDAEVKRAIAGERPQLKRDSLFHLVEQPASAAGAGTFSAEILSPGRVRGIASRDAIGGANLILLRTVIETTDYPLLMSSAGAVVALGTEQSHGAIFARDIGKPLYRCPAVVQAVTEGTLLTLHDTPATIRVGGELPCEG